MSNNNKLEKNWEQFGVKSQSIVNSHRHNSFALFIYIDTAQQKQLWRQDCGGGKTISIKYP